jgi:hypothetical protein
MWQFCGPQAPARDRSWGAAPGLARGGEGWNLPHNLLLSTRCAPGRRAVRWASGRDRSPVAALGLARGGCDLHHPMFLSTRCAPGRRAVRWVRAATGPRSQRLAWHEGVGIYTIPCSFPRAARRNRARFVGFGPRPVPGRSDPNGTRGLGFTPRPAPCHTLRAGTARGPSGFGPRPVPGRSGWLGTKES